MSSSTCEKLWKLTCDFVVFLKHHLQKSNFVPQSRQNFGRYFADVVQNANIQISAISALKMLADSRYADIEKKCRYADIVDADINIGTSLMMANIHASIY